MTALAELRSDGWVHDHRGCQSRAAHGTPTPLGTTTSARETRYARPAGRRTPTTWPPSEARYRDKLESARSIAVRLEQENAELLLMMAAAREILQQRGGGLGQPDIAALLYLLREPNISAAVLS